MSSQHSGAKKIPQTKIKTGFQFQTTGKQGFTWLSVMSQLCLMPGVNDRVFTYVRAQSPPSKPTV